MKKILLMAILVCTASISYGTNNKVGKYSMTVTNLTKGQPLTPALVVVHMKGFDLYTLGEEASEGLKQLAKDGVTSVLAGELTNEMGVLSTGTGSGVFLPGKSTVIEFTAKKNSLVTVVSMLARTNDAFVGGKLHLPVRKNQSVTYRLSVYDAGAEINSESCADIPAPPCGSHMTGSADGEGFVHSHPGVHGIKDLDVLRDAFGSVGAKVTITKM